MALDREFRVTQQMLSAHCALRDRYTRRSTTLDVMVLSASVLFATTTLTSDEALSLFGWRGTQVRLVLALASIVTFCASVLDLRLDWKGKASIHREAARDLGELLSELRVGRAVTNMGPEEEERLRQRYAQVVNSLAPIPEAQFLTLKARHLRKLALSRMIDRSPGVPIFVLRFRLFLKSVRKGSTSANVDD